MTIIDISSPQRLGFALGAYTDAEADEFEQVAAHSLALLASADAPPARLRDGVFALIDAEQGVTKRSEPERIVTVVRTAQDTTAPETSPAESESTLATVSPIGLARGRRSARGARRSFRPLIALVSAAAAVALFAGGVAVTTAHQTSAPTASAAGPLATVLAAPDAHQRHATFGGTAHVTIASSASLGESVAVLRGAPAAAAGKTYQLWFMHGGETTSAGTFTVNSAGATTVRLSGTYRPGDKVAATIEPTGGSLAPTALPVFEVPA